MKVQVYYVGSSIDEETYEGERVEWTIHDGQLSIYVGTKDDTDRVATYPESRVVRVRVIE